MHSYSIGQVANHVGIGVETVRFYEREGLLPSPPRSASGYRRYPASSLQRLEFIRHAKTLGFSLADICELLNLNTDSTADSAAVKVIARRRLADIDARIEALQRMRTALAQVTQQCGGHAVKRAECPILEALSAADQNAGRSATPS